MMNIKQIFLLFLSLAQTLSIVKSVEVTVAAAAETASHTGYLGEMSLGCVADLSNYYFNLKGLTKELDL